MYQTNCAKQVVIEKYMVVDFNHRVPVTYEGLNEVHIGANSRF